jgi:hypothetical protein
MLGEYPGLEQLVHAVYGQEAGHISGQVLRYRHLPFQNNFFGRYLTIYAEFFKQIGAGSIL